MLQEERLSQIVAMAGRERYLSLAAITRRFGISQATARRDLKLLSARGQIRLTRGGAADLTGGLTLEPPYPVKSRTNHAEKLRIGIKAASLVGRGETIILDSGTTMQQIAVALAAVRSVTVATNDIAIAYQLAGAEGVALTMIGGTVRPGYYSTQGYLAAHALENLNADKVFIGVDALDVAKGCMITNDAEIQIKKLMLRSARMVIVACDHAKFSQVAFMNLCSLDQVDLIITGSELDPAIARTFCEAGVNLVLV